MNSYPKQFIFWISGLFIALSIWHVIVVVFQLPVYLLPSPINVISELFNINTLPINLGHIFITSLEAASGFVIGNVLALFSGIILYRSNSLKQLTMPAIAAIQAIPIIAIAPVLIVWFGSGILSKIIMAAVISYFPTMTALLSSFSEVDHSAKLLFRLYRASYLSTVRHLLIPASLPSLVIGLKVSAGLATVGAIVSEMTGANAGIGFLIIRTSNEMDTVNRFVGIILATGLGLTGYSIPNIIRYIYPNAWADGRTGAMS